VRRSVDVPPLERAVKRRMGFVVLTIPNKHKVHCDFLLFHFTVSWGCTEKAPPLTFNSCLKIERDREDRPCRQNKIGS
jgi:hypothetical protein